MWGKYQRIERLHLDKGELYRRLPRGILSKCISEKEGKVKPKELHNQICRVARRISLYKRIQRMGYY